jgi:hypothetical protein
MDNFLVEVQLQCDVLLFSNNIQLIEMCWEHSR